MKRLLEGSEKQQLGEKDAAYARAMGLIGAAMTVLEEAGYRKEPAWIRDALIQMGYTLKEMPKEFRDAMYEVQNRVDTKASKLK